MGLPYIDEQALIAEAGGDPWAINASLQAGSPLQISNLAEAFHRAGRCTQEANDAFEQARSRFQAAWNHQDGGHPINDSDEVQRVTKALGAQSLQLPKIAADLEGIAAALADAQRAGAARIATLDAQLKNVSDLVTEAVDMLNQDKSLSPADQQALHALVDTLEGDALRDTKAALADLEAIRNGYSDGLQKSLNSLHAEGYDGAPLHGADADGVAPPSAAQQAALADIRQATNQAVVDQMAKVRAAQQALDKAMADLYTHGPGSPEGEAASAKLPKLKADLAHALDDLGKIPDYNSIDPASVSTTPDGHFMFTYDLNGQPVQVMGQLKNGTGEFFDQATGTYYTFNGGKLTGMRTPDPGKVEATSEPLFTAVTLAVGGAELKAGGAAAWQGLKTLFSREALEGVTADNVLPRALAGAEEHFQAAERNLTSHAPLPAGGEPVPGTHPLEPPPVEHAPHAGAPVEHAPGEPHVPALPDSPAPLPPDQPPPPPLPSDHPVFHGYHPVDPGPQFTNADGSLFYPDDMLPTKPYAVPGTVVPDAHLSPGSVLSRFGHPGGAYMAPEGTPFAQLSLPPESAAKPFYQYVVEDPSLLPPGWHIEESTVAPWFHQPGGGQQYRIIRPDGTNGTVEQLERFGVVRRIR
ncbi:TNT domain-containing protein [Mycobacterium sp. M23085]|uniref:TNT domain-containing protein n=1 Tax=Mycobacterium sp. M23085 TaxID=3378087 RepID=UPI003878335E